MRTVSVGANFNGGEVDGSGTHFTTEILPGDSISINGTWYGIYRVQSDTVLDADGLNSDQGQPASSPPESGLPLTLINWTKVPATSDSDTRLTFSYERGEPDAGSLVFPQQFQQLHDALTR